MAKRQKLFATKASANRQHKADSKYFLRCTSLKLSCRTDGEHAAYCGHPPASPVCWLHVTTASRSTKHRRRYLSHHTSHTYVWLLVEQGNTSITCSNSSTTALVFKVCVRGDPVRIYLFYLFYLFIKIHQPDKKYTQWTQWNRQKIDWLNGQHRAKIRLCAANKR